MECLCNLLSQADKLDYMGLARVLPGRNLLDLPVEESAAKLSAALSAVVQSDAMRASCQQMQREMGAEDGAEMAACHIRQALHAQPHNPASEVGRAVVQISQYYLQHVGQLETEGAPGTCAGDKAGYTA